MGKKKFYVVWKGVEPGVYDSWTDCQLQIKGYKGALYKSFDTREEAEKALAAPPHHYLHPKKETEHQPLEQRLPAGFDLNCLAVDAACSGNPGPMEYRGVYLLTGQEIFHFGPVYGTNNIGEFLAIVHALALLKQKGIQMPVYSDSRNALSWQDRRLVPHDRTCRKMAQRKYIHDSFTEMGNRKVGRGAGRLWTKVD